MRNPRQNSNRRLRLERHYLLDSARQIERAASIQDASRKDSGYEQAIQQAANRRNAARQFLMLIRGAKLTEDRNYIFWVQPKPAFTYSLAEELRQLDETWNQIMN